MITVENFKDVLIKLGFEEKNNIYSKYFVTFESSLKIDFDKQEIIYPEDKGLTINERQTCNFNSNENFVVFECVYRLIDKGYKPEHIELEPKWKVGHGASGGRADILVKDNSGKALLIIECKTEGIEFKKEWNNTLLRGGQLMSYVQNAGSTKYICLYASDYVDNKIIPYYYVISVHDNEKLLEELKDKKPLSFAVAKALEVEDIYRAWKETYSLDFATKGIFEDDIQAYHIGKQKYTIQDLDEIGSKDIQSKYHEFATIMRQHNVSGRENAFDKLVNLFLCKIVDEAKNPKDLKFYWKGIAYDSYFDLQDRLQLLYQAGMKEFLGEDVTYIDNAAIDKAFRFFKKDPDATRETIKKYFRQLKFFTNNDFAFIDVHNEKLFYQNSAVLLKIVQMLQNTRLQSENQNQFLGDMFEGFLDQGVKQSEGQYFTPMPIVKFILNSLPLENIIKESELPPKAIDYACGAGHFLNELALQMKPFVKQFKETDIKEYYKEIVGIEKEYRLSKVAKVSAFMYGQNEIKIAYADSLAKNVKLQESEFSILVANPPYSVKGFLQTLSEKDRKAFELFKTVDEKSLANNSSIETFFIERAKQLLKPNGVAGIILPSSILSNDSNIYNTTREILIKYFDIVSIVEFGSQTFGKTGTNTVTLFLRRKEENPAPAEHWQNRINSWFANNEAEVIYNDSNYITNYCSHLGIEINHYKTLLSGHPSDVLLATEMFSDYKKAFDNLTEIKNLIKQRTFKIKTISEQDEELKNRFLDFIQTIEKDKLYYYVLASENNQKVLVVKCPTDNKEQKQFLGYEWSSAKGNEGIKYINQSIDYADIEDAETKEMITKLSGMHNINTPLYNPNYRNDPEKINNYIEQNFLRNELTVSDNLKNFISYYNLVDMLDFGRKDFNKQIMLTPKKLTSIQSKWLLVKLEDVCDFEYGKGLPEEKRIEGVYPVMGSNGRVGFHNEYLIEGPAIIIGRKGSAGEVVWEQENCFPIDTTFYVKLKSQKIQLFYLFQILKMLKLNEIKSGSGVPGLNRNDAYQLQIPIPPQEIQSQIIANCQMIDNDVNQAEVNIENFKKEIETIIQKKFSKKYPLDKISNLTLINPSKTEIRNIDDDIIVSFVEMASVSEDGFIDSSVDKPLKDLRKGSYTYFKENDIIIAKITPCMENGKCAIAVGLTNGIGMGSSEFHVIRTNEKIINKYLFAILNRNEVRIEAEKNMTGSSGHRRVPASFYEKILIPVPPLKEQRQLIEEIENLESKIIQSRKTIDKATQLKQEIMKKYL